MEVNVEQGYIILRHTKGWGPKVLFAWGVRKLTNSHWNHAGQVVVEGEDVFVIEAQSPVVVKTGIADYVNSKKYIVKIVRLREDAFASKKEYQQAIEHSTIFLQSKIGSRYDRRAIIGLAIFAIFAGLLKLIKINPFHSRREFFCSELLCESWHLTSSIIQNLFAGSKHPEATCSTITPRDISKSNNCEHIAGKDVK